MAGMAGRIAAVGIAVGLGLSAACSGPGTAPVTAEELLSSVLAAEPGPFGGTVELDNTLGLPPLPQLPQAADGTSTARVWSDGAGRGRVSIPSDTGERTLVTDGEAFWAWNSADRTVVRRPVGDRPNEAVTDPTVAATEALAALRPTSIISVDGTAEVAGRPAYELVLAPAPTERTLLREVRIAVDAEKRLPLRLTVLANGSSEPAVQIGFSDLTFGPQDPELFTFTPPPGATVEEAEPHGATVEEAEPRGADRQPDGATVGEGWDTVLVTTLPTGTETGTREPGSQSREGAPFDLSAFGTPVSGPWGNGRLISTNVAGAIITDDGRVAAGAVPEQVLTEALAR
ncbi:MAG: LolA family protein [Pseudonocardia sp.]